jgi:hypothetical protein
VRANLSFLVCRSTPVASRHMCALPPGDEKILGIVCVGFLTFVSSSEMRCSKSEINYTEVSKSHHHSEIKRKKIDFKADLCFTIAQFLSNPSWQT